MDRRPTIVEPVVSLRVPVSRTPIVGRREEIEQVSRLLARGERLITLTGTGGVGKTRLALAVAEEQRSAFDGRIGWVSLSELADPDLLLDTILRALEIDAHGRDPIDALGAVLGNQPVLLIIDNMEHLAGASILLSIVLDRIPTLSLLATSRVPLRLTAERDVRVAPFLPVTGDLGSEQLAMHPAIRLFVERARAVETSFDPDRSALEVVARIVAQLDYLPLAIELAAARIRHFSLAEIADLLASRLDLLTGGPRDAPDRHRTIRGAIGWSYELLQLDEQRLFRTLAVFPGPFTLDTAVQLAELDGMSRLETIDLISALVDQNLLLRLNEPNAGRYGMLGAIREYGQSQLTASADEELVRNHFAEVVIAHVTPPPIATKDDIEWLGRVERSMDDLRSAFAWLVASGQGIRSLQLASDLGGWWNTRGNPGEGRRMYTTALAIAADVPAELRFEVLRDYSWLLALTGETEQALALRAEIVQLAESFGDPLRTIRTEQLLGALAFAEGDFESGRAHTQHAIELAEDAQLAQRFGGLIFNMATLSEVAGDYDQARGYHQRGLELIDRDAKRGLYSMHQMGLASLALREDDWLEADRLVRDVWADIAEIRDYQVIVGSLLVKAEVYLESGDPVRAAWLIAAADQVMTVYGRVLTGAETADIAQLRERLAQALSGEQLERETTFGRAMTLDALSAEMERAVPPPAGDAAAASSPLTQRETEVARLLIDGKTNPEIAHELFISERTVQSHVGNIMAKLGVNSRAAVAARVVRDGLL